MQHNKSEADKNLSRENFDNQTIADNELQNLNSNQANSNSPLSSSGLNDISSLTEPNSINNSRNSFLDETSSFSNSVTPDPTTNNSNKMNERRPATPLPNQLNDHLNLIDQSNNQHSQSGPKSDRKIVKSYEAQLVNGSKVPNKKFKLKKM